jgi:hypothetical protein
VLVDIAGPDLDRASGGYEADQEDQVGFSSLSVIVMYIIIITEI